MFSRIGHFAAKRSKLALALSLLFIVVTGAIGSSVIPAMSSAGYDDPNADSSRAYRYIDEHFDQRDPWSVLILKCKTSVDDPACSQPALKVQQAVAALDGVEKVTSYWTLGAPETLRSTDGTAAYVFVYQDGADIEALNLAATDIENTARASAADGGLVMHFWGSGALYNGINGRVTTDMARAESIAIPLSLVLTLIVFGGLLAALTPLTVALFAIPAGMFVLWLVHLFTDVSVFGLNILTGLGLGLGIDYALLIVSRFREEQAIHEDIEEAVVKTVETAGRTVFFSGLTVALVLGSLGLFPLYFLQTFAWAGVSTVLFAIVGALVPMPALLAIIGHNIDRWKVRTPSPTSDHGMWAVVANFVMHRPLRVIIGAVLLLGVMAQPALHMQTGQPDERVLPANDPVVVAGAFVRSNFDANESSPVEIVVPGGMKIAATVSEYAKQVSRIDHIVRVVTPTEVIIDGNVVSPNPTGATFVAGDDLKLWAVSDIESRSPDGETLVTAIRALDEPNADTMVGGSAAIYTDSQHGILDYLPRVFLWIALMTLLVLFLFTGSVLLPIKAVLLNILSLGATFGVLTWIFQDGHLNALMGGFIIRGVLDTSQLAVVAVVVFGLSMDYEMFLLSRIKELHDDGESTHTSVQLGLQRSGRIVTAAALILAVVFSAFITSTVTSMKIVGFGIAFAILLDATIVRALLVPALMRLFGSWNWWAPKFLRRFTKAVQISH